MRKFCWLFGFFLLSACAQTPLSPAEQVARSYTQAFLRRSVEEMEAMSLSSVKSPTPLFAMSRHKVIRLCPPEPVEGPEAQRVLVLFGNPEATQFNAMMVIVGHYGEKWLVSQAHLVKSGQGRPMPYNRSCQAGAAPSGGTGGY